MSGVAQEGARIQQADDAFRNSNEPGINIAGDGVNGGPLYPAKYFAHNGAEKRLDVLSNAATEAQKLGFAAPSFDSALIAIAEQRKAEENALKFEAWLGSVYDINDPDQMAKLDQMYPEFNKKRIEYIENQYNKARDFALMKYRGIRSFDDLVTAYAINSGAKPPALLDLAGEDREKGINRGLFNFNKWSTGQGTHTFKGKMGNNWATDTSSTAVTSFPFTGTDKTAKGSVAAILGKLNR